MKAFLFSTLCFLLTAASVIAAENTLISGDIEHGGFGGPVVKISQVNGETAVFTGGRGGWIINHTFIIGGGGYGLTMEMDAPDEAIRHFQRDLDLHFGYGGFEMEFIGQSDDLFHYSVYSLIGAGGVEYAEDFDEHDDFDKNDSVFVFEPALNGELNITTWFRLNVGISYRLIGGLDMYALDEEDIGGLSANITFKFGKF